MPSPEDLRDKLRRLRREPGPAKPVAAGEAGAEEPSSDAASPSPSSTPETAPALPAWFRNRAASRGAAAPVGAHHPPLPGFQTPLPGSQTPRTVEPPARLEAASNPRGTYAVRRERFPAHHVHGTWRLDEVDAADPAALALITGDAALACFAPRNAVYLDIETTGLSGGAGTWPFLVALGRFLPESGEFECWQGFLREPGEEPALLEDVARIVAEADAVVSFFGKSFDRHRLEDKMQVHGVEPPFTGRPHLDLYHPTKRLYGGAWANCRLSTSERELVGLAREDDLPGSQAPAAWFDYLAGRAHQLEAVFQHNLDDVLSLVTLTAHLGRSLSEQRADGAPLGGPGDSRAAGVARSFARCRDRDAEVEWLERALERIPSAAPDSAFPDPAHTESEARKRARTARGLAVARAHALRLGKRTADARQAYECLAGETEDEHTAVCLTELAKLLEHAVRDRAAAADAARRAREVAERTLTGAARARLLTELEARSARLERD